MEFKRRGQQKETRAGADTHLGHTAPKVQEQEPEDKCWREWGDWGAVFTAARNVQLYSHCGKWYGRSPQN